MMKLIIPFTIIFCQTYLTRGKTVLVVSGSLAVQRKSTLTWSVNKLDWSVKVHFNDCRVVSRRPSFAEPSRQTLPYDGEKREGLVFQPEEEGKAHVINVAEYYQNKDKFLEILRLESVFVDIASKSLRFV